MPFVAADQTIPFHKPLTVFETAGSDLARVSTAPQDAITTPISSAFANQLQNTACLYLQSDGIDTDKFPR